MSERREKKQRKSSQIKKSNQESNQWEPAFIKGEKEIFHALQSCKRIDESSEETKAEREIDGNQTTKSWLNPVVVDKPIQIKSKMKTQQKQEESCPEAL